MASAQSVESDDLILIRSFNGFSAETAKGERLPIKNQKAKGLLAYLALSRDWSESRERLAGLLWSDRSEEQARASLRQCVKQLRDAFTSVRSEAFEAERQEISLYRKAVRTDLEDTREQLKRGEVNVALLGGAAAPEHLLYGFESLDQAYSAWLHVVRQQWTDELVDDLQELLRNSERMPDAARRAAEALVSLDPTHEGAHRYLIRTYADDGNVPAALRQYKVLWDVLDQDYDMEPAEETQQLIVEIKSGNYQATPPLTKAPQPATDAVAGDHLPRIEICDFTQGGPGGEKDYMLRGFRQDLIACLVRFREWIVVETQSPPPGSAPGASLVDYTLDGSFFEGEGGVYLVLTLKDATTHQFVWSERIELEPERWFSAQQEIVRRVSLALNVYLSAERVAQLAKDSGLSQASYDLWLKGQDLILHWQPETEDEAEQIFKKIIERTPGFAPAYSSLASIYNSRHIVFPGIFRSAELEEQALNYAQRSVQLDPLDTRSQLALAWSNAMRGRFDQAELHYNLSYELNANNPMTLISCAQGWAFCGNYKEARKVADQAVALNPMMPAYHWAYLVAIHFLCGDYERSVESARLSGDTIPDVPGWEAAALALLGREKEAREKGKTFLNAITQKWRGKEHLGESAILRWFLHSFPIKDSETSARLKRGLELAGLPVDH